MNFSLTDEQEMLADSVARFLESDYGFDVRQSIAASPDGFSREVWRTFAELGWTAIPFVEDDGGIGGGAAETMLIMQGIGRALVVEPYLANVILAGGILKRLATPAQKQEWLAPLIAGDLQAALAFAEPQARYDLDDVATTAHRIGDAWSLNGRKTMVLNGPAADLLLVPARTAGDRHERGGISVFAVPTSANGIEMRGYPTVDAARAADISFNGVEVSNDALLGGAGDGGAAIRESVDDATLAICAEAVGIMAAMQDKTVEYAKNRVQFGVPIGSFQALQHRMVDCMIACEQSRSLLYRAVMLRDSGDTEARRAISAIKYQVGTAGIHVGKESIQIHGGMGVTWELDIAHYFKRLTAINILFGNADYHLDRFAGLRAY